MTRATLLYRVGSVLFVLFAAGHTFGFLRFKPPSLEAFLSWRLGSLAGADPGAIASLAWAFFAVQVVSLVVCWIYFFPPPAILSALLAICLGWAAWLVQTAST